MEERASFAMHCQRCAALILSPAFVHALVAAVIAGSMAAILRYLDVDCGHNFLKGNLPDELVFSAFMLFASLVASFRTSHALMRYTEAACLLHKLHACWYDVASTLVAFCRTSEATVEQVSQFQNTLLRLISLQFALCLEGLEQKASDLAPGHRFEVMGWNELGHDFQDGIMSSRCKVEYVFQAIHQLVVDGMKENVLNIAPPILTRSFQELGQGMLIHHEAKKLACVEIPYAYRFLTRTIIVCEAAFIPWVLAVHTRGSAGAFFYAFFGTFLLWFINGVADSLDNPFKLQSGTLKPGEVQSELNLQLRELMKQGLMLSPSMSSERETRLSLGNIKTMESVRKNHGAESARNAMKEIRISDLLSSHVNRDEKWSALTSRKRDIGCMRGARSFETPTIVESTAAELLEEAEQVHDLLSADTAPASCEEVAVRPTNTERTLDRVEAPPRGLANGVTPAPALNSSSQVEAMSSVLGRRVADDPSAIEHRQTRAEIHVLHRRV